MCTSDQSISEYPFNYKLILGVFGIWGDHPAQGALTRAALFLTISSFIL